MPELPDVQVYVECLDRRLRGEVLHRVRVKSVFTVRTFDPPVTALHGRRAVGFRRLGKRVVIGFDEDLHLVVHLMVAGRLKLAARGAALPGKLGLVAFDFAKETLFLTEAGTQRRAAVHVVRGGDALAVHDPGGAEPLSSDDATLRAALLRDGHTLKRALTDPHLVAGIGNSYSDEILHRARLSPLQRTQNLDDAEWARLLGAVRAVLAEWTDRLRREADAAGGFPAKVTAFREGMAVHGRFGKPCPVCRAPVQRIVSGDREANYCAGCQTGGRILKDRALSRLLHDDWPATLADLE